MCHCIVFRINPRADVYLKHHRVYHYRATHTLPENQLAALCLVPDESEISKELDSKRKITSSLLQANSCSAARFRSSFSLTSRASCRIFSRSFLIRFSSCNSLAFSSAFLFWRFFNSCNGIFSFRLS